MKLNKLTFDVEEPIALSSSIENQLVLQTKHDHRNDKVLKRSYPIISGTHGKPYNHSPPTVVLLFS